MLINYTNKVIRKISWEIFIYFIILAVFIINASYLPYPDEFVNVLGGQFINEGKLPYRDFFDHHLPFAWYLASFLLRFSFGSFILYRIWWAILGFVIFLALGLYLKKVNKELFKYYLYFFFLVPFVLVYFWLHLYIADSLAFIFFSVIFWLLINESYQKKVNQKIIFLLTFLNFIFIFSSLTFIYLAGVFYLWMFYLFIRDGLKKGTILKLIIITISPYLLYSVYLLITGSLKDFYYANFVYNTELYMSIPNFVKGKYFNPIKFALTLIFNFYQNYLLLIIRVEEIDLFFPIALLIGWGSFLFLLLLFYENKILFFFYFLILSFSAPRSDVAKIGETDYQSGVFIALGLIGSFIVLWRYKKTIFKEIYLEYFRKISVFVLFLFLLFSSLFLIKNTYDKFYSRYTQKMPGIYDLSHTANFLNSILDSNDYYWIGPYEPDEIFFVRKGRLPGKYVSLMPQFREHEYFSKNFLDQFKKNKPSIIIYKHNESVFNTPSLEFGKLLLDWMSDNYVNLEKLPEYGILKSPSSFEMRSDLYLLNSQKKRMLEKLVRQGYLKPL